MDNRCLICGDIIPEGRQVCPMCEHMESSFDTVKVIVRLNKFKDIYEFARLISKCTDDVVLKSGHYVVNAKSLLGIFSLNLNKPVTAEFYGFVPKKIQEKLKKFMVK